MNIQPIRTAADHAKALKEIERLWGAETGTPDYDRLDVLGTLVEAYERKHTPIGPPDPVDAIQFALEQRGLTRKDLEKYLGSRARVSEVLRRVRSLSITMIRTLHRELNVPLEALVAEPMAKETARPRKKKTMVVGKLAAAPRHAGKRAGLRT